MIRAIRNIVWYLRYGMTYDEEQELKRKLETHIPKTIEFLRKHMKNVK